MPSDSPTEILLRLAAATVFAGCVGLERERHDAAAGLRTHCLVGLGSALFMLVSLLGFGDSRVAAQVVTGIGFLGAGTIILRQDMVRGLTTAASVWSVAAVGLACGAGMFLPALSTTALALVVLAAVRPLEDYLGRRWHENRLTVVYTRTASLQEILAALHGQGVEIKKVRIDDLPETRQRVEITLRTDLRRETADELLRGITGIQGVHRVFFGGAAGNEAT